MFYFEHIPPNPLSDSPERAKDIRTRLRLAAFGTAMLVASGVNYAYTTDASTPRLLSVLGSGIGGLTIGCSVIKEYQERFNWPGEDDDEEGGDWPPDDGPDDDPDPPIGPDGGLELSLLDEVEAYLQSHRPAGVA